MFFHSYKKNIGVFIINEALIPARVIEWIVKLNKVHKVKQKKANKKLCYVYQFSVKKRVLSCHGYHSDFLKNNWVMNLFKCSHSKIGYIIK